MTRRYSSKAERLCGQGRLTLDFVCVHCRGVGRVHHRVCLPHPPDPARFLQVAKKRNGKVSIAGGCVQLTGKTGLGVELDPDKLAELHQASLNCRIRNRNDVAQMQRYRPDWRQVKPWF